MRNITLAKKVHDLKPFIKVKPREEDCSDYINEHFIARDSDGKLLCAMLPIEKDMTNMVKVLKSIDYLTSTRTGGMKTVSRIFGYAPRNAIRNDYCRKVSLSRDEPEQNAVLEEYGQAIEEVYKKMSAEKHGHHAEETEKVLGEYKMRDTVFTSGIINKNNELNYHYDAGNFKDCFSCMVTAKNGVKGGYLSMPEYDVNIEVLHGSLFLFDGQSILHGVTPIMKMGDDAYRYTVVYYSLKEMWNCLEFTEELARAKKRMTK